MCNFCKTVAAQHGIHKNVIVEITDINNLKLKDDYRLRIGLRGVVLGYNQYFGFDAPLKKGDLGVLAEPEDPQIYDVVTATGKKLEGMIPMDDDHLVLWLANGEVVNVYVLFAKMNDNKGDRPWLKWSTHGEASPTIVDHPHQSPDLKKGKVTLQ